MEGGANTEGGGRGNWESLYLQLYHEKEKI